MYYYRSLRPSVFTQACESVRLELVSRGLRREHRVLDIGSGIGNLAISLVDFLEGGYDGIDVHPEAVAWCQRNISQRHPTFRFHRADLISGAYNKYGQMSPAAYSFPFHSRIFDVVFLGSVFTHMLPDDVEHYLLEIKRLLRPGGVCISSFFLLSDQARGGIDRGTSFMSFDAVHTSGLCRLHDAATPEAAVALDESFVYRAHAKAGLEIREIRRGVWWSGVMHDQDVVTSYSEDSRAQALTHAQV